MGGGVGVSPRTAASAWSPRPPRSPCPRSASASSPTSAAPILLSRAPGLLGLHAALTGAPFSGADAIALGFADHYVPHAALEAFTAAVVGEGVEAAVRAYEAGAAGEPASGPAPLDRRSATPARPSPTSSPPCAGMTKAPPTTPPNLIASRSPVAAVRRAGRHPPRREAVRPSKTSWCRSTGCRARSLRSHDLVEGIRAQIVDKDRNPKWSPPSLAAVTEQDVEDYFAPADPDLTLRGGQDELRDHPGRPRGAGRHHHAEPPAGAQRAQQPGDERSHHGGSRTRRRPRHRGHHRHRQRQGVRRRRRHQGDGLAVVLRGVRRGLLRGLGRAGRGPHPDRSPRSPATRWAAAANWR